MHTATGGTTAMMRQQQVVQNNLIAADPHSTNLYTGFFFLLGF
jgi:hypothetical protein